jgi:hypothetical protein
VVVGASEAGAAVSATVVGAAVLGATVVTSAAGVGAGVSAGASLLAVLASLPHAAISIDAPTATAAQARVCTRIKVFPFSRQIWRLSLGRQSGSPDC